MIVIALVLAFKNVLMGMHFTGESSEVWETNITAAGAWEFNAEPGDPSVEKACHLLVLLDITEELLENLIS